MGRVPLFIAAALFMALPARGWTEHCPSEAPADCYVENGKFFVHGEDHRAREWTPSAGRSKRASAAGAAQTGTSGDETRAQQRERWGRGPEGRMGGERFWEKDPSEWSPEHLDRMRQVCDRAFPGKPYVDNFVRLMKTGAYPDGSPIPRELLDDVRTFMRGAMQYAYGTSLSESDNPAAREFGRFLVKNGLKKMDDSMGTMGHDHGKLMAAFPDIMDAIKPGREGIEHAAGAVRDNPTDPSSWLFLAGRQGKFGSPGDAIDSATQAIGLDPKNPEAYMARSGAKLKSGDYAGAYWDARSALALDPRNAAALAMMKLTEGRAKPAAGGPFSAPAPWSPTGTPGPAAANAAGAAGGPRASTAGPAPGSARSAQSAQLVGDAQNAYRLKDYAAAAREAGKAVELNPMNAQALLYRAMAYYRSGRYRDALRDLDSAGRLVGSDRSVLLARARVLNSMRDYGRAREPALEALRLDPNDAESLRRLAQAQNGLGEQGAALASLQRAAELDPSRHGALYRAALQAPTAADLALLFEDEGTDHKAAADGGRPAQARRFGIVAAATLVGGCLIALGLLHALLPQLFKNVRTGFTRLLKPSQFARAKAAARPPLLTVGAGTYRILRQIGSGGMGTVYEALDLALDRPVAVKRMRAEIRSDPRERERFLKEARLVAALHHPNIVDIYSIVEDDDGEVYLVFEYVEGCTLDRVLEERGRLPFDEARGLLRGICSALEFAHRRDIIHRDLKPSNVMINKEGIVKVMDFGVARQAKDAMTKMALTQTVCGTPSYMAPEAEQGIVRKESDVYSLGVCLYELLTGRIPFAGAGAGMLLNKMNMAFKPPAQAAPGLPAAVDGLLKRALDPDPDKRFRTPAEFAAALAAA